MSRDANIEIGASKVVMKLVAFEIVRLARTISDIGLSNSVLLREG